MSFQLYCSIGEYASHSVVREGKCISLTPELPLQDRSIDWYHWYQVDSSIGIIPYFKHLL